MGPNMGLQGNYLWAFFLEMYLRHASLSLCASYIVECACYIIMGSYIGGSVVYI